MVAEVGRGAGPLWSPRCDGGTGEGRRLDAVQGPLEEVGGE